MQTRGQQDERQDAISTRTSNGLMSGPNRAQARELCGRVSQQPAPASTSSSLDVDAATRAYVGYTLERAERDGYRRDSFCVES
jgi:hypothetical protein